MCNAPTLIVLKLDSVCASITMPRILVFKDQIVTDVGRSQPDDLGAINVALTGLERNAT